MRTWRIVKARHAADAFSGEGARIAGGRWSSPGVRMVYTAETQTLAMLEMLVHLGRASALSAYVLFSCVFDDALVERLDVATLPPDWRRSPAPPTCQRIGDDWIRRGSSVALRVPTVLADGEWNYLVNPQHADFRRVVIAGPRRFTFDPRLTAR
jgi:RES domain-containing protein